MSPWWPCPGLPGEDCGRPVPHPHALCLECRTRADLELGMPLFPDLGTP